MDGKIEGEKQRTDGYRNTDEFPPLQRRPRAWDEVAKQDPDEHCEEDPQGEEAVEETEGFECGDFGLFGDFVVLFLWVGCYCW